MQATSIIQSPLLICSPTNNEKSPLLPINNYAWSKLGGECAVQMYKNSLILRVSMTEKPFVHKSAFTNMFTNFIYHEDFLRIFLKINDALISKSFKKIYQKFLIPKLKKESNIVDFNHKKKFNKKTYRKNKFYKKAK